ncbi:ZIP family metal transporter [Fonticella tunisiensis]|uniref:ZIP family zinc transporter n=1 Tax=Fonticella tunisiensis TaxID=1096341 RepID=A0A4R7KTA5_9CLOT|nr:ZIP family metal transporter [Fonticella tunisiensis]TDT62379.1 ZIP family zinc transporter [Fonticella tunisiensis]
MERITTAALIGTVVCGMGTGAGAVIATGFRKSNNIVMSSIMSIAAGLMLAVVAFDLIPEAILMGGLNITLFGILFGVAFVTILDIFLPHTKVLKKYGRHVKTALLLGIGLAAHNFPEGLAIGSGFMGGQSLGIELALVIGLHDIPEGAAVAAPLMQSGLGRIKIILLTVLTALPTAVGALAGGILGNISKIFITLCLGFAAGTMLYIVCGELIPESKDLFKGIFSTISTIIGVILGLIITSAF